MEQLGPGQWVCLRPHLHGEKLFWVEGSLPYPSYPRWANISYTSLQNVAKQLHEKHNLVKYFVVRLVMRVSGIKTGTICIMPPDELPFVVRRSRRITKDSSSTRTMRLVPVFTLETNNQMNYKIFAQVRPDENGHSGRSSLHLHLFLCIGLHDTKTKFCSCISHSSFHYEWNSRSGMKFHSGIMWSEEKLRSEMKIANVVKHELILEQISFIP